MEQANAVISETESICPVCFLRIPALLERHGQDVVMRKICPNHGEFQALLWRGSPSYESWSRNKIPFRSPYPRSEVIKGCPFDCGLCSDHRQQTCTGLIEVTSRCNLQCAFCFADSGSAGFHDPDLSEIRSLYEAFARDGYRCNIQLSGGEPTLRDDLPEIAALGKSIGFEFIQLNTNGLRLASDFKYLEQLKKAGLSSVFLQFDGTEDGIYRTLRGRDLFALKVQAIRNCKQADLGVVLVPTLVSGVNLHNVGEIISFALENLPIVRGVHFQPVTYVGRYPRIPTDKDRLTLPEVMRAVEHYSSGAIKTENFLPPGCENAHCSFHGSFVLMPDGQVKALTHYREALCFCKSEKAEEGAARTRQCVADQWSSSDKVAAEPNLDQPSMGQWDVLLERAQTHKLAISAMAFQDAWNLDLNRLKDCCIHVAGQNSGVVPFCAFNLTSVDGRSLYRSL